MQLGAVGGKVVVLRLHSPVKSWQLVALTGGVVPHSVVQAHTLAVLNGCQRALLPRAQQPPQVGVHGAAWQRHALPLELQDGPGLLPLLLVCERLRKEPVQPGLEALNGCARHVWLPDPHLAAAVAQGRQWDIPRRCCGWLRRQQQLPCPLLLTL